MFSEKDIYNIQIVCAENAYIGGGGTYKLLYNIIMYIFIVLPNIMVLILLFFARRNLRTKNDGR